MNEDLKIIKKKYGENMMHLCRDLFSTLMDIKPGLLSHILLSKFNPSKHLYYDITENLLENLFRSYIYSFIDKSIFKKEIVVNKTINELMRESGYTLYECKSEEDIQAFKKYYYEGEELCTFKGNRLNKCYVFFAIKDNADKLNREDFTNPRREDEYGTSVISIQFTKDDSNVLSIKNRYNHSVKNPDATFSNDLDAITPGLTKAFEKEYNLIQKFKQVRFEIPGYVMANDGRHYKYNYEINNVYYCPNNIVIDNFTVYKLDERYFLLDYFLIDFKEKKVKLYDEYIKDSFVEQFNNITNIEIYKNDNTKKIKIKINEKSIDLILDDKNRLIAVSDFNIKTIGDNYLTYNESLKYINMPNLEEIGHGFLYSNEDLEEASMINLKTIKSNFLNSNLRLKELSLPFLKVIEDSFLPSNKILKKIAIPNVVSIGNSFMYHNSNIEYLSLPNAVSIGNNFLRENNSLQYLFMPKVKVIGNSFLYNNEKLTMLNLDELEKVQDFFMALSKIKEVSLKKLKYVGNFFMFSNNEIKSINLENLEVVGNGFLNSAFNLSDFYAPNLKIVGNDFLYYNYDISTLNLPLLESKGNNFIPFNKNI